jgi:Lipopolysaccharide-assembly
MYNLPNRTYRLSIKLHPAGISEGRRFLRAAGPVKWLALLAGMLCSGCYTLGPITPTYMKGVHSIAIPIFDNKSFEPQIQSLVTSTFIKQFQSDGTYPITGEDQADAIVIGTIIEVYRTQTASVVGDVLASSEFQLTLKVHIAVVRANGESLGGRDFSGQAYYFVGEDIPTQEHQAIPIAAQDCAKQATTYLTEGF